MIWSGSDKHPFLGDMNRNIDIRKDQQP